MYKSNSSADFSSSYLNSYIASFPNFVPGDHDSDEGPKNGNLRFIGHRKNILKKLIKKAESTPDLLDAYSTNGFTDEDALNSISKGNKKKKNLIKYKQINELVKHLHKDTPVIINHEKLDEDNTNLLESMEHPFHLEEYIEKEKKIKKKWKFHFKKSKPEHLDSRKIIVAGAKKKPPGRRGDGIHLVEDGWDEIIKKADEILENFVSCKKVIINYERRCSNQPDIIPSFVNPFFIGRFRKVDYLTPQIWKSEPSLLTKESQTLLDLETKNLLIWNSSLSDLTHSIPPEIEDLLKDVDTVAELNTKIRPVERPLAFRRASYQNSVWTSAASIVKKKHNYKERLDICRGPKIEEERLGSNHSLTDKPLLAKSLSSDSTLSKSPGNGSLASDISGNNLIVDSILTEDLTPNNLAQELTLLDKQLYCELDASEVIRLIMNPKTVNQDTCVHITAIIGFKRRIIQLFMTFILQGNTPEERAERIAILIEIGLELKLLRNWRSLHSILLCISSPPIARLNKTWKCLSKECHDHAEQFTLLSDAFHKDKLLSPFFAKQANIPRFYDVVQYLKKVCGHYLVEQQGHWEQQGTIADWINHEVDDLEKMFKNLQNDKTKNIEKHKKQEADVKKISLFNRLKLAHKKFESKHHGKKGKLDQTKTGSNENLEQITFSRLTMDGEAELLKCGANNWKEFSVTDAQKLKPDEKREIINKIKATFEEQQLKWRSYETWDSKELASNYLLFEPYNSIETNLEISLKLEPSPNGNQITSE